MSPTSADATEQIWREEPRGGYPDPAGLGLSGLERLSRFSRGEAPPPPLSRLTGARITEIGSGTASAAMPASEWLLNSAGVIGGGTLAIVADIAFGCSIETELPRATPYTTAELSLTFLRPVHPPRRVTASGQAIHVGRSLALSEVFVIEDATERLVAHGTSRCAVLPPIDPAPQPPRDGEPVEPPTDLDSDPWRRPVPKGAVLDQEVWDSLSGAGILDRQLRGELPAPPISYLMGLRPTEAGEGEVTFVLPCTEWLTSPMRTVQGGVTAMLADTAMQVAIQTTIPAGTAIAGLDLKVNYLRPVLPDGRDLTARASVTHSGRRLAIAQARIENADGKPVALATGSSMFLTDRPASLGEAELAPRPDADDQ
jgi:uncharacterized protein (TIGR00369 family)